MTADWASSSFRQALAQVVRRRVPESEVEDVVQATLTEAFVAEKRPEEPEALRKWIFGIARNKVADYHRRARRETFEVPEVAAPPEAGVDDLLRWAMRELPEGRDAEETLEWLLREGEGEKLESIAETERLPAPRVRKRVSRLRAHYKTRWAAQVAALAALGLLAVAIFLWLKRRAPEAPIAHDVVPTPEQRGAEERRHALEACGEGEWQRCVDGLDRAKELDPAGDTAPEVERARTSAEEHLRAVPLRPSPVPGPSSAPSSAPSALPRPTSSAAPRPAPRGTTSLVPPPSPTELPTGFGALGSAVDPGLGSGAGSGSGVTQPARRGAGSKVPTASKR